MFRKKIQTILLVSLCSLSSFPLLGFIHYGPSYSTNAGRAIDTLGIGIAKENGLTYIGDGMGSSIEANKSTWAAFYTCLKKLTLEEACELAGKAQTSLANSIYEKPVFETYYLEIHKSMPYMKEEHVNDYSAATKIAFWDENVDRPLHPYLAEIRVIEGQFLCYYADPKTQALEAPLIRPFHYVKPQSKN